MKLLFSGSPEVTATQDRVWKALLDPHFVAASAPGVEEVEVVSPEQYNLHLGLDVEVRAFPAGTKTAADRKSVV